MVSFILTYAVILGGVWTGGALNAQVKAAAAAPNPMQGAYYLFEYDVSDGLVVTCNQENGNWVITLTLAEKFEGDLADKPVHLWEWSVYIGNNRYFWQRAAGWLDEEKVEIPYTGSAYIRVYAELIK